MHGQIMECLMNGYGHPECVWTTVDIHGRENVWQYLNISKEIVE